jgi:hypothetical protein
VDGNREPVTPEEMLTFAEELVPGLGLDQLFGDDTPMMISFAASIALILSEVSLNGCECPVCDTLRTVVATAESNEIGT